MGPFFIVIQIRYFHVECFEIFYFRTYDSCSAVRRIDIAIQTYLHFKAY